MNTQPTRRTALTLWAATVLLALLASIEGCGQPGAAPAAPPESPPTVSLAPAVTRIVRQTDEFSGRLEATDTVELRPRVGGYIARVHFQAGQEVAQGQLLFTIDPSTYRAEAARASAHLAGAHATAALARTEQTRNDVLLAQHAISRQEHEQSSAALLTHDAAVQAAQAALDSALLNLGYTEIRAPIAGRVGRALLTEGNLVRSGEQVLTSIVSLARVYAYFDASESTYLRYLRQSGGPLAASRKAPVAIQMGLLDDAGFPHAGIIDAFDNRIDAQTGAIRARAVFANPTRRLASGLYARLKLVSGAPVDAVLTPERAIGTDQNRRFVVVVGDDRKAQFREVKLGALIDGMRIVTSGLKGGEAVVVDGLQRVRPGSPVTPQRVTLDERGQPVVTAAAAATAVPR